MAAEVENPENEAGDEINENSTDEIRPITHRMSAAAARAFAEGMVMTTGWVGGWAV